MLDTAPRMICGNWEAGVPSTETMRFFFFFYQFWNPIWNQNEDFQQYLNASSGRSYEIPWSVRRSISFSAPRLDLLRVAFCRFRVYLNPRCKIMAFRAIIMGLGL